MPRKAAQEAIEWTEADRFRPLLGVGSIAAMVHTVHRVGGPERSRVSLGEPPSFIEHDDPLRFEKHPSGRGRGQRSITDHRRTLATPPQLRGAGCLDRSVRN
jgi:hypothetical protein